MPLNDDSRAEVLKLYSEHVPLEEITERTGVPRSTIYYVLDKAGMAPNRQVRTGDRYLESISATAPVFAPEVYVEQVQLIWELQRECGKLEAEREAAKMVAVQYRSALVQLMTSFEIADPALVPPLPWVAAQIEGVAS